MANTKWYKWEKRNEIESKNQPAIYYIAYSETDISKSDFSLLKEIVYIGMTVSIGGLKSRLDQFEATMRGKTGHGGAARVLFKHKEADAFFRKAYVSARIFPISTTRDTPNDWRIKSECVGLEYKSFADYLEQYNMLPEFNDHKKSKKK
jgi:hypothetical protein